MSTQTAQGFTWKTLLFRLVGFPLLAVLAVFILIKLGGNSDILRCWSLSHDGHCIVSVGSGHVSAR